MAGVAGFNPFHFRTALSATPSHRQSVPQISISPAAAISIPYNTSSPLPYFHASSDGLKWISKTASMVARAAIDRNDGWGPDPKEGSGNDVATTVAEAQGPSEINKLKRALVDLLYGTARGLKASSETRAEIVELITLLETKNPTPAPTEALTLLNGKWVLAYTSFSDLFPLLANGTLRVLKVEEISQTIDAGAFTVENSVQFAGPLATTSLSTNAKFEVRSPKRVQIKFEEGIIGTPQLTDSIVMPENIELLGHKVYLSPLKGLMNSVQNAAASVAKSISDRPPLKFPITTDRAQSWLLTTYLDEELRISRGDGSSVFVLIKEGSSLLTA